MEMFDANGNIATLKTQLLTAYYQWLLPHYYQVIDYIKVHQQEVLLIVGLCAFILFVHWWDTKYDRRRRWNLRRGKAMNEAERQVYLDSLMADIICDGIEEAVHAGKMSAQEARKKYTQFGKNFDLKDLKARSPKSDQKKLKSALAKKWWNGHHKPKEAAPKQTRLTLKSRTSHPTH
jgi:hypothetical protein